MGAQKNISFFQSVKSLFANWNVFSGTCSRREFWYGQIFLLLMSFLIGCVIEFVKITGLLLSVPKWFVILFIVALVLARLFLGTLNWTQFVRRYHDVGISGQFFWFYIFANGFLTPKIGPVFNLLGFALLIMCYVFASFKSKKFKYYNSNTKKKKTKGEKDA